MVSRPKVLPSLPGIQEPAKICREDEVNGRPLTTFLVVALILWALHLWRMGRLGKIQTAVLPQPDLSGLAPGVVTPAPVNPTVKLPNGWQKGVPVLPPNILR
jgi:hypothetical protein